VLGHRHGRSLMHEQIVTYDVLAIFDKVRVAALAYL
jgi:hypothetical protein